MVQSPSRIFPLRFTAGTAYVVHATRTVLVDSGPPGGLGRWQRGLLRLGIEPSGIALIIITHGHNDHIGNARALRDWCHAPIVMHREDAEAARKGKNIALRPVNWFGRITAPLASASKLRAQDCFEPDILLNEIDCAKEGGWRLDDYGVPGGIIATPGHTSGSVSVLVENVERQERSGLELEAIVGDILMPRYLAFGPPSMPVYAQDLAQARDSLSRLLEYQPALIHAGHGGPWLSARLSHLLA